MSKLWTPQELELLKSYVNDGLSDPVIGEKLGRSYNSVEKARKRHGIYKSNSAQQAAIKESIRYNTIAKSLKEELAKATPYKAANVPATKGETLMIQFTDWHMGKEIKDETGSIVFNEVIARARIDTLMAQALSLLDNHVCKGTPIKDVVIMLTGDICDGMGIFASQESQSEMAPPFQVMLATEVLQKFILALLQRKLRIRIYGVKGNHGEIRENGKSKDPNANWDLMLYLILEFWLKTAVRNPLVTIQYSELDYMNFEVNGWKYHIRHIAPAQSETSAGKAKFLGWARKHKCDALVYGHYHHWGINDRSCITVFRGGSLPGGDEFSEKLAEESDPCQLMWGCNERRVKSFMYAIDLGGKK